jgi:FkbM family methyltransferase
MNNEVIVEMAMATSPTTALPVTHPKRSWLRGKIQGLRFLLALIRLTVNWTAVWGSRRTKDQLPSLRFRNGLVLHHGPYDSPIVLFDEVFVKRWYDIGPPPAHATMLDVGANIGSVSLFWSAQSPTLRIHAYEPNPAAFETLQRNVQGNQLQPRMTIFPDAVGRASGTLHLWVDVPTDLSTAYGDQSPIEGGRRIPVAMVGLDEAWQRMNRGPIWLLKVDTEGAEADILEGASRQLLDAVQCAIVETHDNLNPGALARCRKVLEDAGFTCRVRLHAWDEGMIYATRPSKA